MKCKNLTAVERERESNTFRGQRKCIFVQQSDTSSILKEEKIDIRTHKTYMFLSI